MKKLLSLVLCVSLLFTMTGVMAEGAFTPGVYTGSSTGFGGAVTVTVTVDENAVTAIEIVGENETAGIGAAAIEKFNESLVGIKSADEVDVWTGATVTSTAVINALTAALNEAQGIASEAAVLVDGVYEGEGRGFDLVNKVHVTVEVKDGKIASVTVGENAETMGMIASVENLFIPRVIEYQTLGVDAITNATASSNGVRAAVADALTKGGMDVSGLYTPVPMVNGFEIYDVDILVVGMGSSGTTAALASAESGLNVLAIDKAGKWGGTGVVTSGPANVNSPSQVNAAIPDWNDPLLGKHDKVPGEKMVDEEELFRQWCEYTTIDGVQGAKPEMIAKVVYESGETGDWLVDYGFEFNPASGFVGGKLAVYTSFVGGKKLTESYFAKAYDHYVEMGGKYMLETEATELIVEDGKIVGVKAQKADGTRVDINAKAVILCTGGFAANAEMQEKYIGEAYQMYGMHTNDGKMIASAIENGAATAAIGIYPMSHFCAPSVITTDFEPADNDIPYGLICTSEGMAVNKNGDRFIDETNISMNAFYQGNAYYYIYSKEQIDILRETGLSARASGIYLGQGGIKADTPLTNIDAVIDNGIEKGFIYKAASIDELAAAIGGNMTAEALKASIAGYKPDGDAFNKAAAKFDRLGTLSTDSEYYVAFTGAPYVYSTCGALDVNEQFQVLDTNGNVMPGLYACGTDSMGVLFNENKAYTNYGGCAEGYCFVSGRDAGYAAAAEIKGE